MNFCNLSKMTDVFNSWSSLKNLIFQVSTPHLTRDVLFIMILALVDLDFLGSKMLGNSSSFALPICNTRRYGRWICFAPGHGIKICCGFKKSPVSRIYPRFPNFGQWFLLPRNTVVMRVCSKEAITNCVVYWKAIRCVLTLACIIYVLLPRLIRN